MNYIRKSMGGTVVNVDGIDKEFQVGIRAYINLLCRDRLTDYNGLIKVTSSVFGYKKLAPLYVGNTCLLFAFHSVRDERVMYINYYQIDCVNYGQERIQILFMDGTKIRIKIRKQFFQNQLLRCEAIIAYLNKKSQESVYNYGLSIEI